MLHLACTSTSGTADRSRQTNAQGDENDAAAAHRGARDVQSISMPLCVRYCGAIHTIGVSAQEQAAVSIATGGEAWKSLGPAVTNLLVDVYFPEYFGWYPGRVDYFDAKADKHCIKFDDGDTIMVRLAESKVRLASAPSVGSESVGAEAVGRTIEVFWPEHYAWYVGKVRSFDPQSGEHQIAYYDGDSEELRLGGQIFRLVDYDLTEVRKRDRHDSDSDGGSSSSPFRTRPGRTARATGKAGV